MTAKINFQSFSRKTKVIFIILLCFFGNQILETKTSISVQGPISNISNDSSPSSDRFEGYNLFILDRRNKTNLDYINRTLLITDLDNNIYFERELKLSIPLASSSVEFVNSTTVLYGDLGGAKLWNIEDNITENIYISGHHEIEKDYIHDTYFTFASSVLEIEGTNYYYDLIREYNSEGILLRSINTRDFIEPWQLCPYGDLIAGYIDVTHSNSLFFDEEEEAIYLNVRNVNTVYKLDYHTGDVIWSLGEYGDFDLFDITGSPKDNLFYHAHSFEKIDTNKFLIFDNDLHNQTDGTNKHSRLVEITVNEDKMQANVTWEWEGSEGYYSRAYGDCDRLPNNNRLGVFGYHTHPGNNLGARLVEVDYEGDIVWELSFPEEENAIFDVYRIERFRFAPSTSAPVFVDQGNASYFEWDVWYNFRSKTNYSGNYYITLDNQLVESDNITFSKFWKSTNVRYYTGDLSTGQHEISLVVADEGGHLSNELDFYESIGSITFDLSKKLKLILGISLGIGIPLIVSSSYAFLRIYKKKPIFKTSKK